MPFLAITGMNPYMYLITVFLRFYPLTHPLASNKIKQLRPAQGAFFFSSAVRRVHLHCTEPKVTWSNGTSASEAQFW